MQMGIVRSGKRATPESHVRTLRVCTRLLSGTSRMLSTLLAAALIENSVAWPTRRKSLPDPPASAASASAPALVPPFDDFLRDNPMAPWSTSTSTSRIRMFPSPRGSIGLQAVAFGALRSAVGLPAQGDGGPADRRGATPTPPPLPGVLGPPPHSSSSRFPRRLPPRLDVEWMDLARHGIPVTEPPPGHPLTPKEPDAKILHSAERRARESGKNEEKWERESSSRCPGPSASVSLSRLIAPSLLQ